jgi:hypothetical protein
MRWALLALSTLVMGACSGGGGTSAQAVQGYLEALVAGEAVEVINHSCAAWEEQAAIEAASFESVEVSLEGLACEETGADGEAALVACTGTIRAVYNGEQQELPLEGRTYRAVEEDGEWKMCGYHQGQ